MITRTQLIYKRCFDLGFSLFLLPFLIVPILLLTLIATIDTRHFGLFQHTRVGQHGRFFKMYKIRSLRPGTHPLGALEQSATYFGRFLRRTKLDELPQVFHVIVGTMSFVGPRPDVPGFADALEGDDRIILRVKPGITGPATLKYRNEELLLAQQDSPEIYNRTIIWVDKVKINKKYVLNWSFSLDLGYILQSILH